MRADLPPTAGRIPRTMCTRPTYHKVVHCLRGTIRFVPTAENESLELQAIGSIWNQGRNTVRSSDLRVWTVWRRSDRSRSRRPAAVCVLLLPQ
jgi:hypothetical protein